MASRRAGASALEACHKLSRGASFSLRTFSSRSSNVPQGALESTTRGATRYAQREYQTYIRWPVSSHGKRSFSTTPKPRHGHLDPPKAGEERHVTFVDKEGQSHTFTVADGDNLLDIAQANDLDMEGACGGSCACSTCHVIVEDENIYDKMEEPDDEENDMLDLAFGLTETSRLGCQVKMSKELDGLVVKLPSMTRNLQASDFK